MESFQVPSGVRRIKQTILQHVYLDCDEDNVYVSHSLSWNSYFTFGWIYFSVKKKKNRKRKRKRFVKVVASFSRERWKPWIDKLSKKPIMQLPFKRSHCFVKTHGVHAFEQRDQAFFTEDFLNVTQKRKPSKEKPKHEFAYTVVLSFHLAGKSTNISCTGPFR